MNQSQEARKETRLSPAAVGTDTSGALFNRRLVALVVAMVAMALTTSIPASNSIQALAQDCENCEQPDPDLPGDGSGGGGGGTASPTVTITGTFRYADMGVQRPIVGADVQILRNVLTAWIPVATARTDGSGSISSKVDFANGAEYGVRIFAVNDAAAVLRWPVDHFEVEPGEPVGAAIHRTATSAGEVLSFSFDFNDAATARNFNMIETLRHGFAYANAHRDPNETDVIPRVNVQPDAIGSVSWYYPIGGTLMVNSRDVSSDRTLLHEYGHFLQDKIGTMPWILSDHDGCVAKDAVFGHVINSPEHAWLEGFADYFAEIVIGTAPAGTFLPTGGLERLGMCTNVPLDRWIPDEAVEDYVAASLWDIADPSNEAGDSLSGFETEIFQIFDRELDGQSASLSTFRTAWRNRGLPGDALDNILWHHTVFRSSSSEWTPDEPPSQQVCDQKPWTPGCEP